MKRKGGGINPELEDAIGELLRASKGMEKLDDRLAVIDRALKLEALRAKVDDGTDGSQFGGGDGEGDD